MGTVVSNVICGYNMMEGHINYTILFVQLLYNFANIYGALTKNKFCVV